MFEKKRPWGLFKVFTKNKKSTIKILEINPGQELSLQKHKKREEHWYFITPGTIQIGKTKRKVKANTGVVIKKNQAHRIIADKKKVIVLEISLGTFSETDEIRLEDKYGRKKKR